MSGRSLGLFSPLHGLVAATVVLALLALWPWIVAPSVPEIALPSAPASAKASPPAVLPPAESSRTIGERPLFSPGRRPAPTAAVGSNTAIENRYRLIGIVTTEAARRAWIAEGTRHFQLGEGDTLDGWKVSRIERDRLVLTSANGDTSLTLKRSALDEKK